MCASAGYILGGWVPQSRLALYAVVRQLLHVLLTLS